LDKKPLVSYVIPCYNQGQFLFDAVRSIYTSYLGEHEVYIIDDASTDPKTSGYLNDIKGFYPSINIIKHKSNQGLSLTRNTGIKKCSGQYIQFLDADDVLVPGKVDYQIAHMILSPKVDVSVTDYFLGNESLTSYSYNSSISNFDLSLNDLLYKWERGLSIPIHCALLKSQIVKDNLFKDLGGGKEDWLFWCRLAHKKHKIVYLNTIGAIYRMHPASWTKSTRRYMGESWLAAAKEINKFVGNQEPLFMERATAWYNEYYGSSDNCDENIKIINVGNKDIPSADNVKKFVINTPSLIKARARSSAQGMQLSVLMPVFNHYEYLSRSISSVVTQLTKESELICINDCSTDQRVNTMLEDLSNLSDHIRIIQNSKNNGISIVTNQGAQFARGNFLAFLDCDDYLATGTIAKVLELIKNNPSVDYFFTDRNDVDEEDHFIRRAIYGGYKDILPSGDIRSDLLDGMVASHLKVIRKSIFVEVGGCDLSLSGVQDWDLALKIAENGNFMYVPEALYNHRIHKNSITISANVNQFRKANIVRRRYFQRRYERPEVDQDISSIIQSYIEQNKYVFSEVMEKNSFIIYPGVVVPWKTLRHNWQSGKQMIYDARNISDYKIIDFIKEFNSFFEVIICNRPDTMTSVLSYLWDHEILYYPWKLRKATSLK
jgi:glycosyltransferase involved in cell wall biosynthesis